MPGMTGLELIQELKSKGNTSSFILFTRHFIDQIAMDSINSGVDYFLVKGDNPNKQFDTLRNIIGKAATKKLNREHLVNKEAKYRSVIESLDNGTHRKER
jgi:DNA-binding NarL/FixJ family response regulator